MHDWSDFYVIVGSAAAALTGLQFVVMALIKDLNQPASEQTISAFGTPTVVHFSMALLTSAILTAPWPAAWPASFTLGALGAASLTYALMVLRRARKQTSYKPVLEDWIWHVVLPVGAYALLTISSLLINGRRDVPPFGVAAAVLLLLCVGIHNSWDTVTYVTVSSRERNGTVKKD